MNSHHIVHSAPASASRKPAMTGSAAGAGANAAGLSGEFAGLFGALMGGSPGQDLAALSGKTTPAVEGLAAQALGPEVNIITASKPSTSDDSLLAFARSQGLDESALAMIFQQRAGAAADNLQRADALSDKATAEEATAAKAAAATAVANMVDLGDEQSMRWSLGKAEDPAAALQAQSATSEILKPVLFGLNGARAGNQLANAGQAAAANAEAQDEAGDGMEQGMAASLSLGDGVAQFAKRMQARTGEARGTQAPQAALAALAGGGSGADSLDASQPTTAESLVVGEDLTGDDLQAIFAQRAEAATAARDADNGKGNAAGGSQAPAGSEQALRQEQYDKLAQRLGEAIGQRLSAQIARGEWKVELALRPHDLGSIDIRLDMKGGELQASFNATHAATRELLADGLPKLKEALAQAGMEVAGLDVNVRQDRQSGGNPTPGRQQKQAAGVTGVAGTAEAAAPAAVAAAKVAKGGDGLDVLA